MSFVLIKRFFQPKLLTKILTFLFLFLLPSQLGKHFFFDFSYVNGVRVDYLSFVLYLTDLLVIFLAILYQKIIIKIIRKNLKLIIIFLLFLISNILISQYPLLSFYRFLKILELYFLFVIFKNFKEKKILLISFLTGGLFQLILCFLQFYQKSSLQGIFYFFGERYLSLSQPEIAKASIEGVEFLRPYGTFSHPNSLGGFYLLLYFFFLTNKNFQRFIILKNFSLLVFTLLIFLSFSKVAIVVYLLLNFFYFFFYLKKACRICFLAKVLIIGATSLIFLQAKTDPLSLEKRITLLKDAFSIFLSYPFFGVGLGHYLIYQAKIPIKYPYFFLQPVHNIFLLFLAEGGIFLTGAIFYFLIRFFKKGVETHGNPSLLLSFFVVFLTGFFDHYWLTLQQNWLLLAVVFGGNGRVKKITKRRNLSKKTS